MFSLLNKDFLEAHRVDANVAIHKLRNIDVNRNVVSI